MSTREEQLANLTQLAQQRAALDAEIRQAVVKLRTHPRGRERAATWAEIGECLEISGSAAQQRYREVAPIERVSDRRVQERRQREEARRRTIPSTR